MALAIFDLDNTLLKGDSDYAWGQFLVDQQIVDRNLYEAANRKFYEQYTQGSLDIQEFLSFSLKPLSRHPLEQLHQWRRLFMQQLIEPMVLPKAKALLQQHRAQGDYLLIITATNRFVTEPIAELFQVDDLLATDPEFCEGRYTGEVQGIPCFQQGKVERLEQWLQTSKFDLKGSYFYSDSHNDLPLLQKVDFPIAVNPDPILHEQAVQNNWPILDLRD